MVGSVVPDTACGITAVIVARCTGFPSVNLYFLFNSCQQEYFVYVHSWSRSQTPLNRNPITEHSSQSSTHSNMVHSNAGTEACGEDTNKNSKYEETAHGKSSTYRCLNRLQNKYSRQPGDPH